MSARGALPAAFLDEAGLNRQHVFDLPSLPPALTAGWPITAAHRQLILIGHGGRRLWQEIEARRPGGEHPVDDYTKFTVDQWFAHHLPGYRHDWLYPGPLAIGLQALGRLAGWHQPSPFGLGIDPRWGSWFAYRAALLTDTDFSPSTPVDRENPCRQCAGRPCIAACPAGATGDSFDVAACVAARLSAGSACAHACPARLACPVGTGHRYDTAQLTHSYGHSLAMLRAWQAATPSEAQRIP